MKAIKVPGPIDEMPNGQYLRINDGETWYHVTCGTVWFCLPSSFIEATDHFDYTNDAVFEKMYFGFKPPINGIPKSGRVILEVF